MGFDVDGFRDKGKLGPEVFVELLKSDVEGLEWTSSEIDGIGVAGVGADTDSEGEAGFDGGAGDFRGTGVGGAADVGTADEREEFGFPGDAFTEIGVEVDDFHTS